MLTARLDGTGERVKERMSQHASIEDWLELGEDARPARKGEKRVRWADIEERKQQARVAEFGFVVGRRDNWASAGERDSAAAGALARTKIIPNRWSQEFRN